MPRKRKSAEKAELLVRRSKRKVVAVEKAEDGGVSIGGDEATPEDSVGSDKGEEMAMAGSVGAAKEEDAAGEISVEFMAPIMEPVRSRKKRSADAVDPESRFVGNPVPVLEAKRRWPERYGIAAKKGEPTLYNRSEDEEDIVYRARRHYTKAEIDGSVIFNLYDDAYVQAPEGEDNYICKIIEMFQAVDGTLYFTAQWFYRAKDTVIQIHSDLIHQKRVFFSEIRNVNTLDCLVQKVKIVRLPLRVHSETENFSIPNCDYYYDMLYLVPYSTYKNIPPDHLGAGARSVSTISSDVNSVEVCNVKSDSDSGPSKKSELFLLDLYSGCGAMSTGLCLGAEIASLNLVTRWAVDLNKYACESLRANHPETEVRNEAAKDFLLLLKEWKKLCTCFSLITGSIDEKYAHFILEEEEEDDDDEEKDASNANDSEIFEVEKVIAICYGDPIENNKPGLYLKVKWKGYGKNYDTWEPIEGLSNCGESIKRFVVNGYKSNILPLPGDVDVICGGPPCQGVSGFNRFRDKEQPLNDPKNEQLIVFMDIVEYLKPRFALMENVVDLMKFSNGYLGKYALGRLVKMNYQTRMGMMVAGAYGLPQFRMRVFMWGAHPNEILPQYPLPTHDVVGRGVCPIEYEINNVTYSKDYKVQLKEKLLLKDAISDLPKVKNNEHRDEMPYDKSPLSEFQRFIRSRIEGSSDKELLYDHRPLELNRDDFERVCQIPKRQGACFRDLPGVKVNGNNNTVFFDPDMPRVLLSSGKPLVPEYAMTFVRGTSTKPFKRLWWDETVPTVVTRAEPHNQQILHPQQDRVLTIRENARLQGFPDYYKLYGPVKERYIQVGNAVAVPVARALGYALALACTGSSNEEPVFILPQNFPEIDPISSASSEEVE